MQVQEALMVFRISRVCCIVNNRLCRGLRQIFIGLQGVFNVRFVDLHSFDSRSIIEDTAS